MACDVLTALRGSARKEAESAGAGLRKLEERATAAAAAAGSSLEGSAALASFCAERLTLEAHKSAAAAQVSAAERGLGCCHVPAAGADADTLAPFPRRVGSALAEDLPALERAASASLRHLAARDWRGNTAYRSLRADPPWRLVADLEEVLSLALTTQGDLWKGVADLSVASAERVSLLSAASHKISSALWGWRSAAADLLSASSINGLGGLVGSEALGCTRRKVSRRLLPSILRPVEGPRQAQRALHIHHLKSRLSTEISSPLPPSVPP